MKFWLWQVKYIGVGKLLKTRCKELIKQGKFIDAIRLYREEAKVTLTEAKDYCDKLRS